MIVRVTTNPRAWLAGPFLLAASLAGGAVVCLATYSSGPFAGVAACAVPLAFGWCMLAGPQIRARAGTLISMIRGIPVLLLVLLASLFIEPFIPEIGVRTSKSVSASPINPVNLSRVALVATAGICTLYQFIGRSHLLLPALRGPLGCMLAFAAMAVASIPRSSLPIVSAGKTVELSVDILFGLLMASLLSPGRLRVCWNLLWTFIAVIAFLVWASASMNPAVGFERPPGVLGVPLLMGWRPQMAPNTISQHGACLAIIAVSRLLVRGAASFQARVFWAGLCGFGMLTMIVAQARTSNISFLIALLVCLFLHRRWIALLLTGAGSALVVAAGGSVILLEFLRRNQDAEQLATLSGRTFYWNVAWNFLRESVLFGHGYYTSARIDLSARFAYMHHDLSTVDNTYLEVLLGVGVIGAIPLLAALIWVVIRILRRDAWIRAGVADLRIEVICVLLIMAFRSSTGSTFQVHSENLLLLVMVMAMVHAIRGPSGDYRRTGGAKCGY